jgi:hypothetical protein
MGHAYVMISEGKEIINYTHYTSKNSGGYNDTVEVMLRQPGSTQLETATRILKLFKKMDKDIAVVHKLFGNRAVAIPHAKYCSRTHGFVYDNNNGCDRTLSPAVLIASQVEERHAALEQVK